nr:hypothetical protein [Tanacetum cinerariifolium]
GNKSDESDDDRDKGSDDDSEETVKAGAGKDDNDDDDEDDDDSDEEEELAKRVESIFTMAASSIVSLQTPTPIMTPSTIATITTSSEA